jgi:ABC-2 type transport system ATP-binding protein
MIAGLLDNDGGTAVVSGNEITTKSTAAKAAIGLVPQDLAIYPDLTARENLRFFGKLYNIGGSLSERVDEILDIIELSDRADDQTKEYSGGMKRRLNIGLGLLHKPDLLILDEPTVGVDPQSRNAILENVERLGAEGMAVLYTTHYMEEAERLCDRVGIIDEGQIIAEGTRRDLVALVGERDRLHLELSGDASTVADAVSEIDGIESCSSAGSELEVVTVSASRALPDVVLSITESGLDVHSIQVSEPDLESVFLHLTGKALRE